MFENILNSTWLGVRFWIWLYLFFSVVMVVIVAIIFYRERIKKKYYSIRFPEKLLKVVIHYSSNYFKEFWRIIPDNEEFTIENKIYKYTDKKILRDNDFYLRKRDNLIIAHIEGKDYQVNQKKSLIYRWRSFPEIHYWFNVPNPIDFDFANKEVDFSSKQMEDFKENDLFSKLLTMDTQKNMLVFIMLFTILNVIISGIVLAKLMGWLDK